MYRYLTNIEEEPMSKTLYTLNQVREMLRTRIAWRVVGPQTTRELAAEVGCTPQFLYRVLSGKDKPSQKIMDYLGLEVFYVRKPKAGTK
jgi:hypothetical protein